MKILLPQAGSMDLNQDGKITIDELFRSTVLIYALIVGAISAVLWGLWVMVAGRIPQPLTFLRIEGAILAFSVPGAAYIGIRRMMRYERQEERDKKRWELEYEMEQYKFGELRGVSEDARNTTLAQAEIDMVAELILHRYYSGKEWSRDAMVKAGMTTAQCWNEANALLKKRGIRRGNKRELVQESYAEAWGRYLQKKREANQHRIANGNWTEAK